MQRFGEKVRILRHRHKLSLRKLATLLGHASHSYITSIEKGELKPNADVILNLSRIFDVPTDALMKDELEV